jgi:hypothetical protein
MKLGIIIICLLVTACNSTGVNPLQAFTIRNIHAFSTYTFYNSVASEKALAINQSIPTGNTLPLQLYAIDNQTRISTDTVRIQPTQFIKELYIQNIINNKLVIKCKLVNDNIVTPNKLSEAQQTIITEEVLNTKGNNMLLSAIGLIVILAIVFTIQHFHRKKQVQIAMEDVEGGIYMN